MSFDSFFEDVTQQVTDSLNISLVGLLDRYNDFNEIGILIRKHILHDVRLRFILVITSENADVSWLPAPRAELERRLLPLRKIWGLDIIVLDRDMAKEKGLIVD